MIGRNNVVQQMSGIKSGFLKLISEIFDFETDDEGFTASSTPQGDTQSTFVDYSSLTSGTSETHDFETDDEGYTLSNLGRGCLQYTFPSTMVTTYGDCP